MKHQRWILWGVFALLGACAERTPAQTLAARFPGARIEARGKHGAPEFLSGTFGQVSAALSLTNANEVLAPVLRSLAPVFNIAAEEFTVDRVRRDEQGNTHVRFSQRHAGLRVLDGVVQLHLNASGVVYAVDADAEGIITQSAVPTVPSSEATQVALRGTRARVVGTPELVYARDARLWREHLAWLVTIEGRAPSGEFFRDVLAIDAQTRAVLRRMALAQHIAMYTMNHESDVEHGDNLWRVMPGTPLPADSTDDTAISNRRVISLVEEFYRNELHRQGIDGRGGETISTIHFGRDYDNAFWSNWGEQLVFGDGGGVFRNPGRGRDLVGHEITHGVVGATAGFFGELESGALNESWGDAFGAAVESYEETPRWSTNVRVWSVADEVTQQTPVPGRPPAIRFMDEPSLLQQPEHYQSLHRLGEGEEPTRENDRGFVHENAGLPNLAFYLVVQGGTHPHPMNHPCAPERVEGLGMQRAIRIWYAALDYMHYTTTMAGARAATVTAARALYVQGNASQSVADAWSMVGVTAPEQTTTSDGGLQCGGDDAGLRDGSAVGADASVDASGDVMTADVPSGRANACPAGVTDEWTCNGTVLRRCNAGTYVFERQCTERCVSVENGADYCEGVAPCPAGTSETFVCEANGLSRVSCIDGLLARETCSQRCSSSAGAGYCEQ